MRGIVKAQKSWQTNYAQYWDATACYSSITSPITKDQVKGSMFNLN